MAVPDWDPQRYAAFGDLRLRLALDLLAQIPDLRDGVVVDLGCGAGAVGPALVACYPMRRAIGLDSSPSMLPDAADTGVFHELIQTDISK